MLHDMRLRAEPFAKIAAGKKTIELRLYDKKRKQIQIGDTIRFTNCDNCQQPIFVAVEKLHIFANFAELYAALPLSACGYSPEEATNASPNDMLAYYTAAEQSAYGVVGIEFSLLPVSLQNPWLAWAVELQSIAQAGLFYGKDVFDLERYARLREIAAEMLGYKTEIPAEKIPAIFCNEDGYQTPKIDTRAAIIQDGKILLVRERNGRWCLPGGWNEVTLSIAENAKKEAFEEAGACVTPQKLVAAWYRDYHPFDTGIHKICKTLVLCKLESIDFHKNSETTECGFFPPDALPPLDTDRTIPAQIELAFAAASSDVWETVFD